MKSNITTCCILFIAVNYSFAVMENAPEVRVKKWVGIQPTLEGKYIFLDFWAIWCKPCIESFSHTNELHKKHGDRIVFIGMTKDNEIAIQQTLKKFPVNFFVAIDDAGQTFANYSIAHLPQAYLISPSFEIIWRGHPKNFNDKVIDSLKLTADRNQINNLLIANDTTKAVTEISIKSVKNTLRYFDEGRDYLIIKDSVESVISFLLSKNKARIEFYGSHSSNFFEISYRSKENLKANYKADILEYLKRNFQIQMKEVIKEVPAWVVTANKNTELWGTNRIVYDGTLTKYGRDKNGNWEFDNYSLDFVLDTIERSTEEILIDNTGIYKNSDWIIPNKSMQEISDYLLKTYNLEMKMKMSKEVIIEIYF
jgi:thiol-disulfide isomerase/thioredoxin